MLRTKDRWLGAAGATLLVSLLAGCANLQGETTAAIPGTTGPTVAGTAGGASTGATLAAGKTATPIAQAISLAEASCDQLKAEIAGFQSDKIPDKLAEFGKAKYTPTAEESIRFARYVDVAKAAKDKNCTIVAAKPKATGTKQTAQKKKATPTVAAAGEDPAAQQPATVTKKKPKTTVAKTTVTVKPAPVEAEAMPEPTNVDGTVVNPDEGVTVTVPGSSG